MNRNIIRIPGLRTLLPCQVIFACLSLSGCGGGGNEESNSSANSADGINISPAVVSRATASNLDIIHRSGQTFVVWDEIAQSDYHVYKHDQPITSENLDSATRLTGKWGPLGQDTSVNVNGRDSSPGNFVVSDLDEPLRDDQGLFVHTPSDDGPAYYAFTHIVDQIENRAINPGENATTSPVSEVVSRPRPVLTVAVNGGKGRIYTQYMDYANWNPTLDGYAYSFAVSLPEQYDATRSYPLRVYPHSYGGEHEFITETWYQWDTIMLFPDDPSYTWWYGFSADHDYRSQGDVPTSGTIENFTEQRVISAMNFLIDDREFPIDPELVHGYGHSMGGSGLLSLGLRYPSMFAGIYASEPMTNYASDQVFQGELERLWGRKSDNLPIVNGGPNNQDILKYGQGGSQPTGVWDWMNHQKQVVRRKGDRFAFLIVGHGKADTIIEWSTQGKPLAQALTDGQVGFSATALGGAGHGWLGFAGTVNSVFGFGYGDQQDWRYPKSLSFPAFQYATDSGPLPPSDVGNDDYNTTIEWATPINNFHESIVDTNSRYEITIRSLSSTQTANVTPRNTNAFRPGVGTECSWNATSNDSGNTVGSGSATVDSSNLITAVSVPLLDGLGTRLSIVCI